MNKFSTFHIVIIFAAVLFTGAGFGTAYYYSGLISDLNSQIGDKESTIHAATANGYMPTEANVKLMKANIELIHQQMDPIVQTQLEPTAKALQAIVDTDPIAWRKHLDNNVAYLRDEAKKYSVELPASNQFYFGFSRFTSSNPSGPVTGTLDKQEYAVKTLCDILMPDKINRLVSISRTFEEDQGNSSASATHSEGDFLPGFGALSASGTYRSYPLQFELECSPTVLRKIINDIVAAPNNIFVIRSVTIASSKTTSIKKSEFSGMADAPDTAPHPVDPSSPGAGSTAPSTPLKGPQYIFGNEFLKVRIRIDLIEWLGDRPSTRSIRSNQPGH